MKREVYCHYARNWIPLGRARTRCPRCGAILGTGHPVRDAETPKTTAVVGTTIANIEMQVQKVQ
jgi:hypothetical protein